MAFSLEGRVLAALLPPATAGTACARRRRRCAPARAGASAASSAEAAHAAAALGERVRALVAWCASRGAQGDGLEVFPGAPGGRGRGLVASRRIEAGETLLRLPLALGLADEPGGHPPSASAAALQRTPWFARLAARLLQEHAAGADSLFAPYLALLPRSVDTSPLLCDAAQLAALRAAYPPLADEADEMRADVARAYALLAAEAPAALAGATEAQFVDAVSVVYSRAYGMRAAAAGGDARSRGLFRVLLPLADMLNHGGDEASAAPDAPLFPPARDAANVAWDIEALDADEDSSALAGAAGAGHAMSVRAITALNAGDEALFSYREEQSGDHFLLYYGFVPALNPHDDVVLFEDVAAALTWHAAAYPPCAARRGAALAAAAAVEAAVRGGSDAGVLAAEPRLKLLAGTRPDARLQAAFAALHRYSDGPAAEAAAQSGCRAALRRRAAEVLTAMGDDASGEDATQPAQQALAHKRRILREAVASLAPVEP